MQTRTTLAAFTLSLVLGFAGSARGQNLLANGSFEDGPPIPVPPGFLHLDPPSDALEGWFVTRDQIDYVAAAHLSASDGSSSLDLNGTPGAGGVRQTFETLPGEPYLVSFALTGNTAGSTSLFRMRVEVDGGDQSADLVYDEAQHGGRVWVRHTWQFTASLALTTLEFYSLDLPSDFGPMLDSVRVEAGSCSDVTRYCTSLPNSTGQPARVDFVGSAVLVVNDAALEASSCPPDSFGVFIAGEVAAQYPFGAGYLCINPYVGFHRILPPVATDSAGTCVRALDFLSLPMTIEPGTSWHFQLVYRDTAAGATQFNTTDGVRVRFC